MSKLVDIGVNCPNCGNHYETKVFRTFWGEGESARHMVYNDEINMVKCPHCGYSFHAPLAMMYVDCQAGFAVWWEPFHDDGVDSDISGYRSMFGANSYYAQAPRIQDWEQFKNTIRKYYSGELTAAPIEKFDLNALQKNIKKEQPRKSNGCLGAVLALITVTTALLGFGIYGLTCVL